jgi:hypothetical protein
MKNRIATIFVLVAFFATGTMQVEAQVPSIRDDPHYLENDKFHPDNDQNNPRNNEWNPNNSRYSHGSNIIRDEDGEPIGYSVEKDDGGVNYFRYDGGGRYGYSVGGGGINGGELDDLNFD